MQQTLIRAMAAAAGALLLAGCGAQSVDIDKLEDSIKSDVKDENGVDVEVKCPDSVDWKKGGSFDCDVVEADGTKHTATVLMKDDDGEVTWQVHG